MRTFRRGQVWVCRSGCLYAITDIKHKSDGTPYKRPVIAMSLDSGVQWAYYSDGRKELTDGPFDLSTLYSDVVHEIPRLTRSAASFALLPGML